MNQGNVVGNNNSNPLFKPFYSEEKGGKQLKSALTVGRANEEAYKAGYKGKEQFENWLKRMKLDDRGAALINQLRRTYQEGVTDENDKAGGYGKRKVEKVKTKSMGETIGQELEGVTGEVYSALVNMGARPGAAEKAAREAGKGGVGFDEAFRKAAAMKVNPDNPRYSVIGTGHWESFDSEQAARKYARLMEGEGKRVYQHGKHVNVQDTVIEDEREENPAVSGAQYRLAQAVLSGVVSADHMPVEVAREIVEKTPAGLRSVWSKGKSNPETSAADFYQSFHGTPSTQTVSVKETEHYHEWLGEIGIAAGVVVETEDGKTLAIGLSGYQWEGKGKDAGFVGGGDREGSSSNPRMSMSSKEAMNLDLTTATIEQLKQAEHALFKTVFKAIPRSQPQEEAHVKRDAVVKEINVRGHKMWWQKNPKRHRGPIGQATELLSGWVDTADGALGSVLSGKSNPRKHEAEKFGIPQNWELLSIRKSSADAQDVANSLNNHGYANKVVSHTDNFGNFMWYGVWTSKGNWKTKVKLAEDAYFGRYPEKLLVKSNPSDSTSPDTTFLSSTEDGLQLYFVGGDQSLDLSALSITGDRATKELVFIGYATQIWYCTKKDFDNFEEILYHHSFGEETGDQPKLAYDRLNQRLLLIGGEYRIETPWGETSPGIEN